MVPSEIVELAAHVAEMAGVALIVGGLAFAAVRSLAVGGRDTLPRYERFRRDLGRAILLGLEVLVAADIVRSVALAPTMSGLAVLAMLVAIRTFLSMSLAVELEGRWPWQRDREAKPAHPPSLDGRLPVEPHA